MYLSVAADDVLVLRYDCNCCVGKGVCVLIVVHAVVVGSLTSHPNKAGVGTRRALTGPGSHVTKREAVSGGCGVLSVKSMGC